MSSTSNSPKNRFTIVIKLGSSSLYDEETRQHKIANMSLIAETICRLRRDGHHVVIVSSGGIAVGLKQLQLEGRPKKLSQTQAVAATGQARLIGLWDDLFRQLDQPIAQILLTRNDVADRTQYLNAANTMQELLNMGIIPIVNENDTLTVQEIQFGDNDTLSAITAGMISADFLFLMTDVDCLYTGNPRDNPDAKPVLVVDNVNELKVDATSTGNSSVGTGGMTTKLIAAELGTSAGVTVIICRSSVPGNIHSIVQHIQNAPPEEKDMSPDELMHSLTMNEVPLHTRFLPKERPIGDRKFWILHTVATHGAVIVDKGAYEAITRPERAGLLPVGVLGTQGNFHANQGVEIYVGDRHNPEAELEHIGKCLVNYPASEIENIKGLQSNQIEDQLGYADSEYIAFRENMAFFSGVRPDDKQ